MASFKNKKNLLQQRGEYARYFDRLRGVDFSSDHNDVEDSRFSYLVNMYRDYQSGQGGAVETIPGFRVVRDNSKGKINGIHVGYNKIFVHQSSYLYLAGEVGESGKTTTYQGWTEIGSLVNDKTTSFNYGGALYIIGSGIFVKIRKTGKNNYEIKPVHEEAYVPTTYKGLDPAAVKDTIPEDYGKGYEVEERNLLTPFYMHTFIADGETASFDFKEPIDNDWQYNRTGNSVSYLEFPDYLDFDVYQYGVRLPLAIKPSDSMAPKIPDGYPNAITYAFPNGSASKAGQIRLIAAPPKPEENTWNPIKKAFDYTEDEIKSGKPATDKYEWPYAYPEKYDGIVIKVKKDIKTVGGAVNEQAYQHSIISNCRIVAMYDNRVFLSGNPNFPRHVFFSRIPNDESGVPSAAYFGQLDYTVEGSSKSKVVGMMNVGDSLMVLKSDGDEDDSILLHSAQMGPSDVQPKIYPSQKGHKGLGCLGPCFNFRDDPIFISKNGVDALGHVSTKYRRAIKHRSSMIDAKLLNCDLKNVSIAEWNGYLMMLSDGKLFMADSRQMYNTPDGGTEYEWYYLEDIGVYNGQFDEYVYAEFPTDQTEEQRLEATGGVKIVEARAVRDDNGIARDLIGSPANSGGEEIKSVETEYGITYYRELPEYNEFTDLTGRTIKYYVVPSGGKTGGEFDPAVLLKTIGDDLYFATAGGTLCKFNFDMRDPETGLIPHEYYSFNGRAIFSGCATKMDNCGIPHLTKTTVKRSTVIKTRSFESSGIKVKVRTNRRAFNQIARIVNGQATFDDPDFKAYSFSTADKNIFAVNEREKKWVEKQIFLYSDEYCRPFAIHYIAYRYVIAGRYKE